MASNNRLNNQAGGKAMTPITHKTGTTCARTAGEDTCPCKFSITKDQWGYYFCCGMGNSNHEYHVKVNNGHVSMPTRFLNHVKQAILLSVAQANISDGVARNVCYQRTKVLLLQGQIRSLHKMSKCLTTVDESLDHADHFLDQFKKNGVSFCLLYHHKEEDDSGHINAQLINEINELPNDEEVSPPETECLSTKIKLNNNNHADMSKFAIENRAIFNLVRGQEFLLGLAYVYPKEKRIFRLFPTVLKIDATLGTNDEKRPLLTITVADQNGKYFIIFRALLPNERAWTFKRSFQICLVLTISSR
jgi:hypothetical protein